MSSGIVWYGVRCSATLKVSFGRAKDRESYSPFVPVGSVTGGTEAWVYSRRTIMHVV